MDEAFLAVRTPVRRTQDDWRDLWSHRSALVRIARPRCPSAYDAEDVVHEAILRAAEADHVAPVEAGPWLTRVVVNLCHDLHRRPVDAALDQQPDLPQQGRSVEEVTELRDEVARLGRRFARLPERQRQAVALRAAGLGVEEIAVELGTSYKTTESLLSRARSSLRGPAVLVAAVLWLRRAASAGPVVALAGLTLALTPLGPSVTLPLPADAALTRAAPAQERPVHSVHPESWPTPSGVFISSGATTARTASRAVHGHLSAAVGVASVELPIAPHLIVGAPPASPRSWKPRLPVRAAMAIADGGALSRR